MLSNAYFLAKFRFDTAENEPAKKLQKFAKFTPREVVGEGAFGTVRIGTHNKTQKQFAVRVSSLFRHYAADLSFDCGTFG